MCYSTVYILHAIEFVQICDIQGMGYESYHNSFEVGMGFDALPHMCYFENAYVYADLYLTIVVIGFWECLSDVYDSNQTSFNLPLAKSWTDPMVMYVASLKSDFYFCLVTANDSLTIRLAIICGYCCACVHATKAEIIYLPIL